VRERVAAEVVQRVAKTRCPCCVDREHVHPFGIPIGQMERLRLEPAAYEPRAKAKACLSETFRARTHT
jgi:hypothetical protein